MHQGMENQSEYLILTFPRLKFSVLLSQQYIILLYTSFVTNDYCERCECGISM